MYFPDGWANSTVGVFFFALLLVVVLGIIFYSLRREQETANVARALLDNSPFFMEFWDENAQIFDCNKRLVEVLGVEHAEFLARFYAFSPMVQPCGQTSEALNLALIRQALDTGYARAEWNYTLRDGSFLPVEATWVRMKQGNKTMVLVYSHDLRPLKAAMESEQAAKMKLYEQGFNERMHLMLESTPLMVELWDESGKALDCNQATLDFFLFNSKQDYFDYMDESSPTEYDFYTRTKYCDLWNDRIQEIFREGAGKFETIECRPGVSAYLEVEGVRTVLDGQSVVITYAKDMTSLRQSEQARERALENERAALAEAQAASRAKSSFLSSMSHEIRTPMSAVIGMAEIAKNAADPARKDECLDKILGASQHLLRLINQTLDMSKIEANKFVLDARVFDMHKMLDNIRDIMGVQIDMKDVHFSADIAPNVPLILIQDEARVAQVIINLLNNAVKFTPAGGSVTLAIALAQENTLHITVRDTGVGIPEESQSRLFQAYEQTKLGAAQEYGGTGLGLAVSKSIVEMMGGEISFKSTVGVGTLFTCLIPFAPADVAAPAPTEEAAQLTFPDRHILIAEDVELNREILLAMLEPFDVATTCAADGVEAIHLFTEAPHRYHLILMDIQMPQMDGIAATTYLRNLDEPLAKSVPIIAVSANAFHEDVAKCLDAGMNDHISKPVEPTVLAEKMGKWLGRSKE